MAEGLAVPQVRRTPHAPPEKDDVQEVVPNPQGPPSEDGPEDEGVGDGKLEEGGHKPEKEKSLAKSVDL